MQEKGKYTTVRIKVDTLTTIKRISKQTNTSVPKTIDAAVALLTLYTTGPQTGYMNKEK